MSVPEKTKPNEILGKHGPAANLIIKLQRYSLLGWGLFFSLLVMDFIVVVVGTIAPKPVIAVDESGRVLGVVEYLSPDSRSDDEIIKGCKRMTDGLLSLNAATVFEDYADAMNMMDDEMLKDTNAALSNDNYLARVKTQGARSHLEFDRQTGATVANRNGMSFECRVRGNILVDVGGKEANPVPFDMTLSGFISPRTSNNTAGLKFHSRKDN